MNKDILSITRRDFFRLGAASAGSLVIGFYLPACSPHNDLSALSKNSFSPNAWLSIDPNSQVTIKLGKSEMGQGVMTALPMLIAEELEVELKMVNVELAKAHPQYGNQSTGGSKSIQENWITLRKAGAVGRLMLISAAAEKWLVKTNECYALNGTIYHKSSGRRLTYGELVVDAAKQAIPEKISLKDPGDFRLIGHKVTRLDLADKVKGLAKFGIDIVLPGMLVATITHSPAFGGKPKKYNKARALSINGVRHVLEIESGVVVVADGYWQAQQGLKQLNIQWSQGHSENESSAAIYSRYESLVDGPGTLAYEKGSSVMGTQQETTELEAIYKLPHQAHATMEPMNCVAFVHESSCEIWAPTQNPQDARYEVAQYLYGNIERKLRRLHGKLVGDSFPDISIHTTYLGCGFGRRLKHDFILEAVQISKKLQAPIKLIWSREEDIQHDYYRPSTYNKLHAKVDKNGFPLEWHHRIVCPEKGRSIDGADNIPYAIPYIHIDYIVEKTGIPIGSWRSVGGSLNAFVIESFIDEMASQSKLDPYQFRTILLKDKPRHRDVLDTVTRMAGWGQKLPDKHYHGLAMYEAFNSIAAQIAEVSVSDNGDVHVHKVICALNCGIVVNHDIVKAQIEGGIIFGLNAVIKNEITISGGRIEQSNFDDFPLLRMHETPEIEVAIVTDNRPPGGVGEVGVTPIAPAVVNAVFAATGKRIRQLPIRHGLI